MKQVNDMNILRESNSVLRDEKTRAIDEKEAANKTIKELELKNEPLLRQKNEFETQELVLFTFIYCFEMFGYYVTKHIIAGKAERGEKSSGGINRQTQGKLYRDDGFCTSMLTVFATFLIVNL